MRLTTLQNAGFLLLALLLPGCRDVMDQQVAEDDAADEMRTPPKLVLQITVDQLRGDLVARYQANMGAGGFRYLLENGAVFSNAHHRHANTETVVGHSTLATGADPSVHGMIANVWFDRTTGSLKYNVEDPDYPILSAGAGVNQDTEIDPTQRAATSDGRSPLAMMTTTFSDELQLALGSQAKVFGVSVKDRGAITLAGHGGKAFWFSKQNGQFITSSYYYDEFPQWVNEFNAVAPASRYENTAWELLHDASAYLFGDRDDQAWETAMPGFGRVFPHDFGSSDSSLFYTLLTLSPAGDELTADFAMALLDEEELGQDDVTDYLSVSFSSTDYVGHVFGPSSLEAEDNLLHLDRTLAELFQYIDEKVGLENTLIVLSADHGSPEAPGTLQEQGVDVEYIDPDSYDTNEAISSLKQSLKFEGELISTYFSPYLYLNDAAIIEQGLDLQAVEKAVVDELVKFDGVHVAVSSQDLRTGNFPDSPVMQKVLRNYNPSRSGNIYIVFEPGRFINDFDGLVVAATHGSPWQYDTYVPIIFAGQGIAAAQYHDYVETVSVAATLSQLLGVNMPSGSDGQVLTQVLD